MTLKATIAYIFGTILLLTNGPLLHAQTIQGKVVDAETNKPVANASVYLNGTYKGTSTDAGGNFSFTAAKTNIPLMVSSVGYSSQVVRNYWDKAIVVSLKARTYQLREVAIGKSNRDKAMRIFLREFIGTTDKTDCRIDNPDDIWFDYNEKDDSLAAKADKPLIIYNKTLGYKITYFLDNFNYTPTETSYTGNYFFAEDTAFLKPVEIKNRLAARNEAYYGSRMHFIRALWANDLKNNGFHISAPIKKYVDVDDIEAIRKGITYENIIHITNGNNFHDQKYIGLRSVLHIAYKNELSSANPIADYEGALIDSNGYYSEGLVWNGDMGLARVNKLLPFEFEPVVVIYK